MTPCCMMTSTDGVKHSRFFFLLLSLLLSLVFTPPGVSLIDETNSNTKEKTSEKISAGRRKHSHRGRARECQLPDEILLESFLQNVTGDRDETWSTSFPACQWRNVTCNNEGKVSEIVWATEKLKGTLRWESLPSTVEHITLTSPDFDRSLLIGTIDFSLLPRGLKTIDIKGNSFKGPLNLTILPPHLETANFSENDFSGTLDLTQLPPTLTRRQKAVYLADPIEWFGGSHKAIRRND